MSKKESDKGLTANTGHAQGVTVCEIDLKRKGVEVYETDKLPGEQGIGIRDSNDTH